MAQRFLKQVGLIIVMMVLGTAVDWAVHASRAEWGVPFEYYQNKILYGAAWGLIGFYALKYWWGMRSPQQFAIWVPAIIAGVLQTKYFYLGYPRSFVFLFLFLHFLMFLPFSWYIFTRYPRVFLPEDTMTPLQHVWVRRGSFITTIVLIEVLVYIVLTRYYPLF